VGIELLESFSRCVVCVKNRQTAAPAEPAEMVQQRKQLAPRPLATLT
jgi:hypothetical protein